MPTLNWPEKNHESHHATEIQRRGVLYPHGNGYPDATPENRLILGENLGVMNALLAEYENRFDLIYADPPFFTNRHFKTRIGRGEDSRRPAEWRLDEGYADHWPDLDAYLSFLYPRLKMMHRLLSPRGTLYLHLDWHANAYARVLLDEIFGAERLLNEIVWVYHGPSPIRSAFNRKHDTILAYTKSPHYFFDADAVREPYSPNTVKTFASSSKAGFGKKPNLKRGKVPEDWWYFPVVARLHRERTGYPTQKPEALLERIILASSPSDGLVGDFFCGSGTTAAVAARLGRRFVAVDANLKAVYIQQARLAEKAQTAISLEETRPPQKVVSDPEGDWPRPQWWEANPGGVINLQGATIPTELFYWEVDPDWDGKIFRSARQAVRPWRNGDIPRQLTLPVHGRQVRVQMRKITGETRGVTLQVRHPDDSQRRAPS